MNKVIRKFVISYILINTFYSSYKEIVKNRIDTLRFKLKCIYSMDMLNY